LKVDATSKLGFSTLLKCTTIVHMLAYGVASELVENHLPMGESTYIDACTSFAKRWWECLARIGPNDEDTTRLLAIGNLGFFAEMLGTIDCMQCE
jgi:hypothetical protein